jgi:ketosteroid isomerase-like protein
MAEEPASIAREIFECFAANDPDSALELMHEDIEWTPPQDEPETGTLHGREGVMGIVLQWSHAFEDFRATPLEFVSGEDCVVVPVQISGRGKGTGAEVTIEETMVFWVREGKVSKQRAFRTKAEALKAAGLE